MSSGAFSFLSFRGGFILRSFGEGVLIPPEFAGMSARSISARTGPWDCYPISSGYRNFFWYLIISGSKADKFVSLNPADKEIPRNHVIILQHPVQGSLKSFPSSLQIRPPGPPRDKAPRFVRQLSPASLSVSLDFSRLGFFARLDK